MPVAVYGVVLSLVLLTCAIAWWRTDLYGLLLAHYGLSLAGVLFEVYFLYLQVFVIRRRLRVVHVLRALAVLRFVIAFVIWIRQPPPEERPGSPEARGGQLAGRIRVPSAFALGGTGTAAGPLLEGLRGDRERPGGAAPIS